VILIIVILNGNLGQVVMMKLIFLSCLRNNFLIQHVTEPTCFRASDEPNRPTLDLILSDEHFISNLEYLSPVGKSDHVVLSFDCELALFHVIYHINLIS